MKKLNGNAIMIIVFTMIVGINLFLNSCGFKDIDKRVFVTGIGIDPPKEQEDGYRLTLKISLPVGSSKESPLKKYTYLTGEGDSLGEAIRELETHVDKVLEFGHAKVILINQQLLTENIPKYMDYFIRRADIQMISYVGVTTESAEQILQVEPLSESIVSTSLFNYFDDTGTESPFITTLFLFQFRRDYLSKGIDPVLPVIQTNEAKDEIMIKEAVVVSNLKDVKPYQLTPTETKYFNSLFHKMHGFDYRVEKDDLKLLLNIDQVNSSFKIEEQDGIPTTIRFHIKMEGVIVEANKWVSSEEIPELNQLSEKEIKKNITRMLQQFQEKQVDPFGIGLKYRSNHWHHHINFDDWLQWYPHLAIQVDANVSIKSTGTIE